MTAARGAALPRSYGRSRLVVLAVDPYHVHAYWEVTLPDRVAALECFSSAESRPEWVLRFHDISGTDPDIVKAHGRFDVSIQVGARKWYVDLWAAGKSYIVELGLVDGETFCGVCRAQPVHLPNDRPLAPPSPPTLAEHPAVGLEPPAITREEPIFFVSAELPAVTAPSAEELEEGFALAPEAAQSEAYTESLPVQRAAPAHADSGVAPIVSFAVETATAHPVFAHEPVRVEPHYSESRSVSLASIGELSAPRGDTRGQPSGGCRI